MGLARDSNNSKAGLARQMDGHDFAHAHSLSRKPTRQILISKRGTTQSAKPDDKRICG